MINIIFTYNISNIEENLKMVCDGEMQKNKPNKKGCKSVRNSNIKNGAFKNTLI